MDLAKVGDPLLGVAELSSQDVSCQFNSRGFDLLLSNYKSATHQLKISNLKAEIVPEKCTCRIRPTKVILSLHKKDPDTTWYDLMEKKK